MPITETPVAFASGGQQVVGMLHLPGTPGRCPAVLMLHGYTGSKHETHRIFVQEARSLAREGIASLRFDFRGCGDSGGEFHEMTVSSMCADARIALAWLSARPEVDGGRVGLLGMSLGGMIGSLLVHEYPAFRTAAFWCPVTNPRRLIAMRTTPEAQRQIDEGGVADMGGWPVGRRFIAEMMAAEPKAALQHATFPLLFVHGDADPTVPWEDSSDTVKGLRLGGRNVSFHTIVGADHGYGALPWIDELLRVTTGWFRAGL